MKYKLDVKRDVDIYSGDEEDTYMLWLPFGFRFDDDLVHCRGYDSMDEVRQAAKNDVISCDCKDCQDGLERMSKL